MIVTSAPGIPGTIHAAEMPTGGYVGGIVSRLFAAPIRPDFAEPFIPNNRHGRRLAARLDAR